MVIALLAAAPAFQSRYLALVDASDGDPGPAATLTALADYVDGLADEIDRLAPRLLECAAAVETMAGRSDDDAELVAWAFLDSLSPEHRACLAPWFGPRTRILLDEVDDPGTGAR